MAKTSKKTRLRNCRGEVCMTTSLLNWRRPYGDLGVHYAECVPVLGVSVPPRICDPSVPASPADRYGKEVAETENKAKKKQVSHNNGDFNVTRA
jgi:hypothetical protein